MKHISLILQTKSLLREMGPVPAIEPEALRIQPPNSLTSPATLNNPLDTPGDI